MTKEDILKQISSCKDEWELHLARKAVNYYQENGRDIAGYNELNRAHKNKSEQLAKGKTFTRLNY